MEKTKNERSVELAVRRQLAYRSKLAQLGFDTDSPGQDPMSLQVSSSSYPTKASNHVSEPRPKNYPQNHIPKPLQTPHPKQNQILILNSNPNTTFPRPNLSGSKRKEIPKNVQDNQSQEPKPKPKPFRSQPDYITMTPVGYSYCNICQVPCSCPLNLQQHLNGNQHKNKLHLLECFEKGVTPPFCDTCHICCTNEDGLKVHYNSKKHKSMVRELEEGGGERKGYRHCDLCRIWCMDEGAYQQHLKGRKHIARLYEEQNKNSSS